MKTHEQAETTNPNGKSKKDETKGRKLHQNRPSLRQAAFFRGLVGLVIFPVLVLALVGFGVLSNASVSPQRSPPFPLIVRATQISGAEGNRTLTFADRVAYQRAIEEVYWQHRIWPKANAGPKPPLDKVMSQAQIEKKVEDYLRDSQALEAYWQKPIASEQLQDEIDRMAQNTKQPEVLQELFEALGNDPFVIAECLARPVLTERLVADLSANDKGQHFALLRIQAAGGKFSITTSVGATYALPEISIPDECTDETWTPTSTTNAPAGRYIHSAVWTGSEMIVWGGHDGTNTYFNTGGRYNPSTDSWTATSTTDAPTARDNRKAVWTGIEMIIWGGHVGLTAFNTGGRYNPSTDSWTATSTTNAPSARYLHATVWTGSEMMVWGGFNGTSYFNTGGRYNPSTDSWTATSTTNAPGARQNDWPVWTGSEMVVWGGFNGTSYFNTGGRYNPSTDSWTAISTTNAPSARYLHTAVWTGDSPSFPSQMIVWGGYNGSYLNTGGRYEPSTDSWTATSLTNAPDARQLHTAVWTGSEMIVWGGGGISFFNTGGRYNPSTDSWTATSTTNAPTARTQHREVWTGTGSQMIIWGGTDNISYFNTGGRYCAVAPSPTPTPTPKATATATPTATAMATATPTATPTPHPRPTPRPHPTPPPRPTPPPHS